MSVKVNTRSAPIPVPDGSDKNQAAAIRDNFDTLWRAKATLQDQITATNKTVEQLLIELKRRGL